MAAGTSPVEGCWALVLRQNSMRTEDSAIPCRDGCPIQVIPSPARAKNLPEERPRGIPVYIRMEGSRTFSDATLLRIRQPDRIGGAALPPAHTPKAPRLGGGSSQNHPHTDSRPPPPPRTVSLSVRSDPPRH